MYSQSRYQQEDFYDDQGGYESQKGCYNDQYFDSYSYGGCRSWKQPSQEQYQPRKTHDEYDDPPESYQESSYDHDYEHSREYQTTRYYRDGYEEDHDQEDYYYEHRRDSRSSSYQSYNSQSYPSNHFDEDNDYLPQRGSTNSQSYDSYPSQAYSPQSYTQNTPPPKKKSIIELMYEHLLNPKPKEPNDPYKTIEEHLCEDMKLQVICHACKGPHYRYQCQKYPYCDECKAKVSCECRGKYRWEDEVDQRCNAKPQGKYGLSEETWALARRLGINIVPDDSMEEEVRVTPRIDQCVIDHGKQMSFKVPLEGAIEDAKESEQEVENPDGGNGKEFQNEVNEEELPLGETFEAHYGKTPNSTCVNTTLYKTCVKSWADMCEEDDCDDIGVPNCVDNCDIDNIENAFVEPSCDDDSLALVDNSLTSEHDDDIHEIFYFDDENNVDDSLFEANKVEFSDFLDTYLDDALFVHDMIDESGVKEHDDFCEDSCIDSCEDDCMDACVENIVVVDVINEIVNDEESEYANVEEKDNVEGKEEIANEESVGMKIEEIMKNDEEELQEERKDKEKKKMEENSTLIDMDSCQPLEESVLCVNLKEFLNARHLRAYLEERVDGEKRLVSVQVCLNDGSKVASG